MRLPWTTTGPQVTQTMNEWNPSMQGAGKIAMSGKHSLLIDGEGNVWSWGQNDYGQLGIGNNSEQLTPVKITALANIVAVAAGDNHSLALDQDGNVWVWGRNNLYQLGNGSTSDINVPVKIITGNIKSISAAADHSIALKNDGTVLGWGADSWATYFSIAGIDGHTPGQLIYNTAYMNEHYPLSGVKGIATSHESSAYLFDDGRICRIGYFIDQVGAKTLTPMKTYTAAMGIKAIAAGENFVLALKEDGTVLTVGDNNSGQYGDGTIGNASPANPRPYGTVTGLKNIVAVAAGGYHGLALDKDGYVYTWGKNLNGQLGTGKTDIHLIPVKVGGLEQITAIGGGTESSMAFRNMLKDYVWGNNDSGQLGDGSKTTSKVPTLVKMAGYEEDIDAPVWPAYFALIPTGITENSMKLDWTPASDDLGVTGYEIYVDGEKKADVDNTTVVYTVSDLTPKTTYTFGIKAKDAVGNISVMSKTMLATTIEVISPKYTISADNDASFDNEQTLDGINTMTVKNGVTGFKYFSVHVTPVTAHNGSEAVVFVHSRNGMQLAINATKADFDLVDNAQAGFNVHPGDVVKAYIVDDLTNAVDCNPVILQ